jgi:hypothetical protein
MSRTEKEAFGKIVYIVSLLSASPAVSVKKLPGEKLIIRKNANQK